MREDIRIARVKKYGSFLYCPIGDTLCSHMDNEFGVCPKARCILKDPEYIERQKAIENARKKNAAGCVPEKPQTNIRTQTKTRQQIIQEKIEREEKLAERLYRSNRPNAAMLAHNRAQILRGEL